MSVKVMSLVFEYDMPDLVAKREGKDDETVRGSTAKFVLLALADHANGEGEGAYPTVETLSRKTNFSERTVCTALIALMQSGFLVRAGQKRWGTYDYTINVTALNPVQHDSVEPSSTPVLNPVQPGVEPSSTKPSLNHPLTKRDIESDGYTKVIQALEKTIGILNTSTARYVDTWLEKHEVKWVLAAIDEMALNGARSVKYVDQVLITWEANGYPKSREEKVQAARASGVARGSKVSQQEALMAKRAEENRRRYEKSTSAGGQKELKAAWPPEPPKKKEITWTVVDEPKNS